MTSLLSYLDIYPPQLKALIVIFKTSNPPHGQDAWGLKMQLSSRPLRLDQYLKKYLIRFLNNLYLFQILICSKKK